jgi:hypothetical protein
MKYVYRHGRIVPKDEAVYVGITNGPFVIRDEMPPTEQVDGKFYTSKARFRAKGRELGLIEVGTEQFKPKRRMTWDRAAQEARIRTIKDAMEKCRANPQRRSG